MAINNIIRLTGNMGSEVRIIEKEGKEFGSFSLATTDSYKDAEGQWQTKETVWHQLLIFHPELLARMKTLKTGTRLDIEGTVSYRPFEAILEDGNTVQKMEASIIPHAYKINPLVKKAVS